MPHFEEQKSSHLMRRTFHPYVEGSNILAELYGRKKLVAIILNWLVSDWVNFQHERKNACHIHSVIRPSSVIVQTILLLHSISDHGLACISLLRLSNKIQHKDTPITMTRQRESSVPLVTSFLLAIFLLISSASSLQLAPLLSTCVDACQRGCLEIRNVQKARDESFQVELKDAQDPRSALTEADFAAQKAIVGALRQEWGPDLCIVGEEDGDAELDKAISAGSYEPLKRDMFEDDIGETPEIDPSEFTIYVDPLDGTREFVEERLENCQVLVGIAIGGESVAGAIG